MKNMMQAIVISGGKSWLFDVPETSIDKGAEGAGKVLGLMQLPEGNCLVLVSRKTIHQNIY
ncbi:MAG: hypothetical protein ABIJ34_08090 [archaeon]